MAETTVLEHREQLILSSILFDKETKEWAVYKGMNPDIFQNTLVKKVIAAFNAVSEDGTPPTIQLLLDQLGGTDKAKQDEWALVFKKLEQEVPPEPKEVLEKHLDILRDAHLVRRYGDVAKEVLSLVHTHNPFDLTEEKARIKNYIENAFLEVDDDNNNNNAETKQMSLSEGVNYTIKAMKDALTSDTSENVTSGYDDLDEALDGGFKKGTFALIAARPGMGKTVWMLNSAVEAAKAGQKVLFISIEMNLLQCFQRLLAKLADLSGKKIQRPEEMQPNDWKKLQDAAKEIIEMHEDNFWVQEVSDITVPQLERMIKYYKKKFDIDAVYVDYAQIILTKEGNEPKESSDFAQISGGLRRAAKNQEVAMIVGSQLNREVEKRNDKKPIMADIRNSGAFEQDAAYIIGLYRDEVYNGDASEKPNIIELIFMKNRFGKNNISLEFNYDLEKQAILQEAKSV